MNIRCAIIGCGPNSPGKGGAHSIAYAHAEAMRRIPGLTLVAAASRTPKNLADFEQEFPGCRGYRDYRRMLEEQRADLVAVCAYPPDREAMVTAAIAAGARGVLIEKPMAMGLGAARRIMAAGAGADCRLFVHHQRRYGKPFEWWREAVAGGALGELESIDLVQPFPDFMGFGPHLVDAALYAMGSDRKAVRAMGAVDMTGAGEFQGSRSETQLLATVHFADGVRLSIEAGKYACARVPTMRANGTRGFAELRLEPMRGEASVFRMLSAGADVASPATNEHFHHSEDPTRYVQRAYEDMLQALTTGAATRIDAAEGLRGLEIMVAAYESARLGRVVHFPVTQEAFPLECTGQG